MRTDFEFQFMERNYSGLSIQFHGIRPTRLLATSRLRFEKISLFARLFAGAFCIASFLSPLAFSSQSFWSDEAQLSREQAKEDLAPYRALEEGRWEEALHFWEMREHSGLLSAAERFNLAQLERRLGKSERAPENYLRASLQGVLPAAYEWARHRLAAPESALGAPPRALFELAARAGFAPAQTALEALEQGREVRPFNGWLTPGGEPYVPAQPSAPRSVYNRAACAEASRRPARSAYLFIDAYAAGKLAHTLAKARGQSGDALTAAARRGMWEFHAAAARLSAMLGHALVNGELPLLPGREPSQIEQARRDAQAALSRWKRANEPSWKLANEPRWRGERAPGTHSSKGRMNCRAVQRLSASDDAPLGPLPERKHQKAWLEQWIRQDSSGEASALPCALAFELPPDSENSGEIRSQVLQLDFQAGVVPVSFRLWNSLFRYFEEAWRLQPEWLKVPDDLSLAFQTLSIEEMLLWVSAGCESLTHPECDAATLTSETLRELLVSSDLPDPLRAYPKGQGETLIESWENSARLGADSQGAWKSESASLWVRGVQETWAKARGDLLRRERKAIQELMEEEKEIPELDAIAALRLPWSEVSRPLQAYALCSEWSLALHPDWGILHAEFERMREIQASFREKDPDAAAALDLAWTRFRRLSGTVIRACDRWEKSGAWENLNPLSVAAFSFSEWMSDLTNLKSETKPNPPRWDDDSWQALRAELSAWVELRSTALYGEALKDREKLLSTELFNPLTAPTACGLYDPTFHRRATWTRFLVTTGGLAVSALSGVPGLILAEPVKGHVQRLDPWVEKGHLRFRPVTTPESLALSLWMGSGIARQAWCSLSLGSVPVASVPVGASFAGVSVSACRQDLSEEVQSNSPENWASYPDGSHSCFTCSMNFVSNSASPLFSRVGASGAPALWGNAVVALTQLVQALSDPHEIPRVGHPKRESVRATWERHQGSLPEECVTDLVLGRECDRDSCARSWEKNFEKVSGLKVRAVKVETNENTSVPETHTEGTALLRLVADPKRAWKVIWQGGCLRPSSERWESAR